MSRGKTIAGLLLCILSLIAVVVWQAQVIQTQHEKLVANESLLSESLSSPSGSSPLPESTGDRQGERRASNSLYTAGATNWPKFDWHRVESDDYRSYVKNLRQIGCPDDTIRDIVTADLVQTYASRRSNAVAAAYSNFCYWATEPSDASRRASLLRSQRDAEQQIGENLSNLLGGDALPPDTSRAWRVAGLEQQLGFLPAEKRDAVVRDLVLFEGNDAQISALVGNRPPTKDPEELQRIIETHDARLTQLAQALTPEEYEQLQMSVTWTAANVRRRLAEFQPTEEEFRSIFREWWTQDQDLARRFAYGQPDPGKAHVLARLKESLGEARYADFVKSWKP